MTRPGSNPFPHGIRPCAPPNPPVVANWTGLTINIVGDLQKVHPEPGDMFVLTCEQALSMEQAETIRDHIAKRLAVDGASVIVLGDGLKLSVVGNAGPELERT